MKHILGLLVLLVLLVFGQFYCHAQIKVEASLKKAIEQALEKDRSLQNQTMDIEKLELNRQELLEKYIPRLEATSALAIYDNSFILDVPTATLPITGFTLFEDRTELDSNGKLFRGELRMSSVLFTGNQIQNGAKALDKKAEGTSYLLDAEKDKIAKATIKSFDELFLIKASEELLKDTQMRLDKESERVEKAIKNGVAVPYDRDKIKLAQLELKSKSVSLEDSKDLLYRKITYLTGYSQAQIKAVSYELLPYLLFETAFNLDDKQELLALESYKEALEFVLKKEKGSNLPKIAAFAAMTYTDFFDSTVSVPTSNFSNTINVPVNQFTLGPNWILGLGMKWELFSGFERKHKIKEAKINIDQMQNKIDDSQQKLELMMNKAISNYQVSLKQIDITAQSQKIADNNLDLATKQYREGIISIVDRLTAENDLYKASLQHVQNIINQRQSAIDVLIATGALLEQIEKN